MRKTRFLFSLLSISAATLAGIPSSGQQSLHLDGTWQMGEHRTYVKEVRVPGIHCDPAQMNRDTLWYRREVKLPDGKWEYATLELKGARFAPAVFVDGVQVSRADGGMAPTFHLLGSPAVRPGQTVVLEIALTSLRDLPVSDASYIAESDHWRSNISSSLWDSVILHFHGDHRVTNLIPDADPEAKRLALSFFIESVPGALPATGSYRIDIRDSRQNTLISREGTWNEGRNDLAINYGGILDEWSPEHPALYEIQITLNQGGRATDCFERKLGVKRFEVRDRQFYLNGKPCKIRGGSITWHRWMRTPEGSVYGYDTEWFAREILTRMKERGANEINFHLGLAPSCLLDLCDEYGILVRYEWSFFHGMPASEESCREQYKAWFATSMEHPCATFYYPYNETSGEQLSTAWAALDKVLADYPPLVIAHRDILHLHKYWWSIFENLGVYYDDYRQFDQAVMADEFGGNYLDRNGDYGGYPSVPESFLRFCGRDNTQEMRLRQLSLSTGKIAEYWRRTDVAGWSPYTLISSYEDGNTWFLGDLSAPEPMPVWDSMTAAWSPQAVSMDLWDVNFRPGEAIHVPLHFFNDLDADATLRARVSILDSTGRVRESLLATRHTAAWSREIEEITISLPDEPGRYTLRAELLNPPEGILRPVVSDWTLRTFVPEVPEQVAHARFYTPEDEAELAALLRQCGLLRADNPEAADVLLFSARSWQRIAAGERSILNLLEESIRQGRSVILLDVGPRGLGKGYPVPGESLKSLLNPPSVSDPQTEEHLLFGSLSLRFKEAAEAETNIFPDPEDASLWSRLPPGYRGMWNGLRGDLAVPAWEMEVLGVNADLFLAQWTGRGAEPEAIRSGQPYYAYELHGYYGYSDKPDDPVAKASLKSSVLQKIEDAPSLAVFINPDVPIQVTDLAAGFRASDTGMAERLVRMANAGKNLTRIPVFKVIFGPGQGELVLSQLLTAGRLDGSARPDGPFDARYDGTAVQIVLNMIESVLAK